MSWNKMTKKHRGKVVINIYGDEDISLHLKIQEIKMRLFDIGITDDDRLVLEEKLKSLDQQVKSKR